jgi:hypothetical protein
VALPGCGESTTEPKPLAAVCAQAARESRSIVRRRVEPLVGDFVPVVGPSRREAKPLEAAVSEASAVDRKAAAAIRRLPRSEATRAALANLAANEHQLAKMKASPGEIGLDSHFIGLGGALRTCRAPIVPIGG